MQLMMGKSVTALILTVRPTTKPLVSKKLTRTMELLLAGETQKLIPEVKENLCQENKEKEQKEKKKCQRSKLRFSFKIPIKKNVFRVGSKA